MIKIDVDAVPTSTLDAKTLRWVNGLIDQRRDRIHTAIEFWQAQEVTEQRVDALNRQLNQLRELNQLVDTLDDTIVSIENPSTDRYYDADAIDAMKTILTRC